MSFIKNGVMKENNSLGIIGGLGPASTLDYYKNIIEKYREITGEYPHILINSVNMDEILNLMELEEYGLLADKLLESIISLKKAGATIGAISSNTPHIIFNQINDKSPIQLISIVESTVEEAINKGYKKVLLTGTIFTMDNDFYKKEFEKRNIQCIIPNDNEKEIIHNIIFPNLENGIVMDEDKIKFIKIVEKIISSEKIDGVVLGCTELPLMIKNGDLSVPILNTTEIHINKIVELIIN